MEGQTFTDKDNPTELEQKHIPVIEVGNNTQKGEKEIKITIGQIPHPMGEDHHIDWLELKKNGRKIGRVEFSTQDKKAQATFSATVNKGDKFVVHENCNLHGLWYGQMEV